MAIIKNILVGLGDGMGTGAYLPGYLAKKISGRNFYSIGEAIDRGELTLNKNADRTSLEYQIMKGIGDVLGVTAGSIFLFLPGIAFDIMKNRHLRKKQKLETEIRDEVRRTIQPIL